MHSIYPIFKQNRILKQEALTAIRDYSYNQARLTYQDYTPGILAGCNITAVSDSKLEVSPGILKIQDKVLLLPEPEEISYAATDCMQYLKVRIEEEDALPDFITYQVTFLLDRTEECRDHELEFCRFHLRQGAKLRDQYKDFFDLETEYDTVNLLSAAWGGIGGRTFSPLVMKLFAEEILKAPGKRTEDVVFAYTCLNQPTGIAHSILRHYVNDWKSGTDGDKETNRELYRGLCEILEAAQSGRRREEAPKQRRKILID